MRVMALFQLHFFAKYLRVGEDGPGQGHLCHTDTFLVDNIFGKGSILKGKCLHPREANSVL